MKKSYLLVLFIISILYSCEKEKDNKPNDLNRNPPKTPEAANYDLNNDLLNDIKVVYLWETWDGINISGDEIVGLIEPLNGSSILLKRDEYPLFNKLNDTIKVNSTEPYYWEMYSNPSIVAIFSSSCNHGWSSEWKIQSNMATDCYYMGIKISKGNNTQIGWIKIKIDNSTGDIQILDKKFKQADFIVIGN